jgi:CHAT domain-containing protein
MKHLAVWASLLLPVQSTAATLYPHPWFHEADGNGESAAALEPGTPLRGELVGNRASRFKVTLAAGDFLQVRVDQQGIDVALALLDPAGAPLISRNVVNGRIGVEPLFWIAGGATTLTLELRATDANAGAGAYQIETGIRPARPADTNAVAAQQAFAEAEAQLRQRQAQALRQAIPAYERALALWAAAGDPREQARTHHRLGRVHDLLGDGMRSLDDYARALPLWRQVGDHQGEGRTLSNIGACHNNRGEYASALRNYEQALPLLEAAGDENAVAGVLQNIGLALESLGDRYEALGYLERALQQARRVGAREEESYALTNIGRVCTYLGEYQKAQDLFAQALPLARANGDGYGEGSIYGSLGSLYADLGDFAKAAEYHKQALALARARGDERSEAYALFNLGGLLSLRGDDAEAAAHYAQALERASRNGDQRLAAYVLTSIGEQQVGSGKPWPALESLARAREAILAVGDRPGHARTLNRMGEAHALLHDAETAADHYEQALTLYRSVNDRQGQADVLSNLARIERDRGNLAQARLQMEEALRLIESIRERITTEGLRVSYFASVQKQYALYVDLLMRQHLEQPSRGFDVRAYEASERGRARGLLELLRESHAEIREGVDAALLERERTVRRRLSAKAEREVQVLGGEHTAAEAAALAQQVQTLTADLEQVEAQIRTTSPRYAALTQPEPMTLAEIQRDVLDSQTLLLEYALGDERSYLWAVTPTSLTAHLLPKRAEIEEAARQLRGRLAATRVDASQATAREQADYWTTAAVLSRIILGPVAAELGTKRLLIVSDGALQYVPFAALPFPDRPGVPLVVEHEIVSLPSASVLAVLRRDLSGRAAPAKALVVLADPVFDAMDERLRRRAPSGTAKTDARVAQSQDAIALDRRALRSASDFGLEQQGFARLPFSRREAKAILALVPDAQRREALDFDASRLTATSSELAEYRYVHFATHGLLNSAHPELSGIVLSLVDRHGRVQDGFLPASDVFNLKLRADLVVLSACTSGLGKDIKGEGLVGLTRGFMYAGAARVLASLWKIDDAATAELMKRFYRGVLGHDRLSPAAALRAAQVSLLNETRWQDPRYWAAFVLQGEPN